MLKSLLTKENIKAALRELSSVADMVAAGILLAVIINPVALSPTIFGTAIVSVVAGLFLNVLANSLRD